MKLLSLTLLAMANAYADFIEEGLRLHNQYRGRHQSTASLTISDDAVNTAQKIADKGEWAHSPPSERNNYGENLAWNTRKDKKSAVAQDKLSHKNNTKRLKVLVKPLINLVKAVQQWYAEIKDYDWKNPGFEGIDGAPVGHFTQVVWKNSKKLGIGAAKMKMNGYDGWLVVGHYDPAGNVQGKFEQNVMPLK